MKSKPIKRAIEKFREKSKEERQKIRKIVIRKRDDFITALDKNWRDWFFRPLTKILFQSGVTANHITYLGFVIIVITTITYFTGTSIKLSLFLIILAALSDMIDGPMARNNNNITILGTWLDHIRDYTLVALVTYILYAQELLTLELIIILWGLQLILIWTLTKDFLIQYLKELPAEKGRELLYKFSLDNLQTSIIGRFQFASWIIGYISLLMFLIWPIPELITLGNALLIIAAIFAALNIYEATQKTI